MQGSVWESGERSFFLYTWKDVERAFLLNKDKWENVILDVEIYADEIYIYLNKELAVDSKIEDILHGFLGERYDHEGKKIWLALPDGALDVVFEEGEEEKRQDVVMPLFQNILYQRSAYQTEMLEKELPGAPVLAFHSYKGGVGRTLSLLAFVKAWSALNDPKNKKKLLIVDADLEAPGITWLTAGEAEEGFSFLDLLEVIQEKDDIDEMIRSTADKVSRSIIKVETEKSMVEHIVLPAYRYIEQLLDMYASPESLAQSYDKKYVLAEVLSRLGETVDADLVLVDLRAGLSGLSSPLLFDPRVKKYLVTSTSYQSVKGTELILEQLNKGLPLNENSKIPEILLTMGPEGLDTTDIISKLVAVYDRSKTDENMSITDDIVTELPFASELVHLTSLQKIMKNLNGRDFYKNIEKIVQSSYIPQKEVQQTENRIDREQVIRNLHAFAKKQITAEGNGALEVLMTDTIKNLIRKYDNSIPNTVIMGAKGAGKTFLYREILRGRSWERFVADIDKKEVKKAEGTDRSVLTVPLLASSNAVGFHSIIEDAIQNWNDHGLHGKIKNSVCTDNKDILLRYIREDHDPLEWKSIWQKVILNTFQNAYPTLEELDADLKEKRIGLVFLIDGLEEIFSRTIASETEKKAIMVLCRDMINEIKTKYEALGLMVFIRKDMVRDSITVNFEQFNSLYDPMELKWSSTEALRLVIWMVSQVVPDFYHEDVAIEMASREMIDHTLNGLWGIKLGRATSNEANSSRWILAALSDFNGQLQARDMIRFLEKATIDPGKTIYPDRYLMPTEIKKAVSDCSNGKISEIRQEIKALGPILDRLERAPAEKKVLPFHSDTFDLTQAEEKLMKQEGYLRIENDRYYLPEIIRHALKFKYGKGARPKVLSLLLR